LRCAHIAEPRRVICRLAAAMERSGDLPDKSNFSMAAATVNDAASNPRGDGGKRNSSPGRSRISRKTIAWGMPDVSGASAVNTGVTTNMRAPGCGCIGHPAFPAPSSMTGEGLEGQASGATRAEKAKSCLIADTRSRRRTAGSGAASFYPIVAVLR